MNGINSVKNYECWFLVKQKTKNKKIKKWGKKVSWHPHLYILLLLWNKTLKTERYSTKSNYGFWRCTLVIRYKVSTKNWLYETLVINIAENMFWS